jgi:hypothetical protein
MTLHRMRSAVLGVVCLFLGVVPVAGFAAGAPSVSFVGVGDFAMPVFSPSQGSLSSKIGYGAGMLIGLPLTYHLSFEFGGLYVTRKFDQTDLTISSEEHAIQVPALFRLRFNRFISFGVGGYYAQNVGDITSTSDVTGVPSTNSPASSGYKASDYGLMASVAFHIPLSYTCDLLLDGRYAYGLDNEVSDAALAGSNSVKSRDAQAVIGLTFHMMHGR